MADDLVGKLKSIHWQSGILPKLFREAGWQKDSTLICGLEHIRGLSAEAIARLSAEDGMVRVLKACKAVTDRFKADGLAVVEGADSSILGTVIDNALDDRAKVEGRG